MYATRRLNPKLLGPNEGYITLNDPYDKVGTKDGRTKGKQFITNPPKKGQTEGYFKKFEYVVDSYQDNNGYRITQPRSNRKLGFGSYDANRRDEFTLDIRASQYRELLEKEKFFESVYLNQNTQRGTGQLAEAGGEEAAGAAVAASKEKETESDPRFFQTQVPHSLYDIGRDGGVTPTCNKCNKETFYCKHRVLGTSGNSSGSGESLRRVGPHKTSSQMVGAEIARVDKPTYGRKSHIKDFYDQNHLSVMKQ